MVWGRRNFTHALIFARENKSSVHSLLNRNNKVGDS